MKNSELPLYQPPRARDLSAFSASGLAPLGYCADGAAPYEKCVIGPFPEGYNPPCEAGFFPDDPLCSTGTVASSICRSGAAQAG